MATCWSPLAILRRPSTSTTTLRSPSSSTRRTTTTTTSIPTPYTTSTSRRSSLLWTCFSWTHKNKLPTRICACSPTYICALHRNIANKNNNNTTNAATSTSGSGNKMKEALGGDFRTSDRVAIRREVLAKSLIQMGPIEVLLARQSLQRRRTSSSSHRHSGAASQPRASRLSIMTVADSR